MLTILRIWNFFKNRAIRSKIPASSYLKDFLSFVIFTVNKINEYIYLQTIFTEWIMEEILFFELFTSLKSYKIWRKLMNNLILHNNLMKTDLTLTIILYYFTTIKLWIYENVIPTSSLIQIFFSELTPCLELGQFFICAEVCEQCGKLNFDISAMKGWCIV